MKLTIRIERQDEHQAQAGTLRAYVVYDKIYGKNLLTGKKFTRLDSAKLEAEAAAKRALPGQQVDIEWKFGMGVE